MGHSQVEAHNQIVKIQSISEERITALQNEVNAKKKELRTVTEKVGKGNGLGGKEFSEKKAHVSSSSTNMSKWKEKVEAIENLLREIRHGIESIGVTLGISFFSSNDSTLALLEKVNDLHMIVLKGGRNISKNQRREGSAMEKIIEDSDSSFRSVSSKEFDNAMEAFNANRIKIASRIQGGPTNEARAIESREERNELHGSRQ